MNDKGFDSINVIPFIDILLVLLAIVLMTSTFIASGSLAVALPRASNSRAELLKTCTVEIDRQGSIYFNARRVYLNELKKNLGLLSRDTPVLIRADRDIPLQVFVDALDELKKMRFRNVSLQTEVIK